MATHSSILAWRIPWTEEPGGLQKNDNIQKKYTHVCYYLDISNDLACIALSEKYLRNAPFFLPLPTPCLEWLLLLFSC